MMECSKCHDDFPEEELQISHDIPRYIGGTDLDGRHYLCKKCHKEYEWEVLKMGLMSWISQLPLIDKLTFKLAAKTVKRYFFKNG